MSFKDLGANKVVIIIHNGIIRNRLLVLQLHGYFAVGHFTCAIVLTFLCNETA